MKKVRFGYWINKPFLWGGPHDALEQGMMAEESGFDSVWIGDHYMLYAGEFSETFVALTAIGVKTREIMVSPSVTDPYRRHPATIAQTVASIDRLTGGRAGLGIGAGITLNLTPFGIEWRKPLTALKEAITVIKMLWASTEDEPASFEGEMFPLHNAYVRVKPVQRPHPPIYVGALGTKTRELTGKIADGYIPWINSSETYRDRLKDVERGAREVGRSIENIDSVAVLPLAVSESVDEARRAVEGYCRTALMWEGDILERYGFEISVRRVVPKPRYLFTREDFKVIEQHAQEIPIDLVEKISAYGTPEDCLDKISEFLEAGANHIVFFNYSVNLKESMRAFHRKIIPYFKEG